MNPVIERLSDEIESLKRERTEIERERAEVERMKSENASMEGRREELREQIAAMEERAKMLDLPAREAVLLAAAEAAIAATTELAEKSRVYPNYLRAKGWRGLSVGWTHPTLCGGCVVLNSAVALQVAADLKSLRTAFEDAFKQQGDRAMASWRIPK
jgi:predicted  nucleic acid-binding Zn-ribbon protein